MDKQLNFDFYNEYLERHELDLASKEALKQLINFVELISKQLVTVTSFHIYTIVRLSKLINESDLENLNGDRKDSSE